MSNVAPSWLQEIRAYWSELVNQETAAVSSASRPAGANRENSAVRRHRLQAGTAKEAGEMSSPPSMLLYGKFGN